VLNSHRSHPRVRRDVTRGTIIALAVSGLVALPAGSFGSGPDPEPVTPRVTSIALDDVLADPNAARALGRDNASRRTTAPMTTRGFLVAGITWADESGSAPITIEMRSRRDQTWSGWTELHIDEEHAPDPDSTEAVRSRPGTDPLVVGRADAVQVRVEADDRRPPRDLELELVDPGASDADAAVARPSGSTAAAAPARPQIYTRAQWGADESLREQGPPDYGQVLGAFVHHTAGTNTYSADEVPAIIRGIYAYHVNGRGWRDIGYNFLIDRFGRTWEGRYGGIDQAVVGAHTAGYNSNAFAMSVLGTYTSKEPEPDVIAGYKRLFAWKFFRHGVIPSIAVAYPDQKTLQPVAGHRDTSATECPGQRLYDWIPNIRAGTTRVMGELPATVVSRIRVSGPASAAVGSTITLRVWWSAREPESRVWVTGTAHLQRWYGGEWQYVRRVAVVNGRGSTTTVLDRGRYYRVVGHHAPGLILPTSATIKVTAE
jgi:N-acetylmuramoyl-L-alanine amidase